MNLRQPPIDSIYGQFYKSVIFQVENFNYWMVALKSVFPFLPTLPTSTSIAGKAAAGQVAGGGAGQPPCLLCTCSLPASPDTYNPWSPSLTDMALALFPNHGAHGSMAHAQPCSSIPGQICAAADWPGRGWTGGGRGCRGQAEIEAGSCCSSDFGLYRSEGGVLDLNIYSSYNKAIKVFKYFMHTDL